MRRYEVLVARAAELGCTVAVVQTIERLEAKLAGLHERLADVENAA